MPDYVTGKTGLLTVTLRRGPYPDDKFGLHHLEVVQAAPAVFFQHSPFKHGYQHGLFCACSRYSTHRVCDIKYLREVLGGTPGFLIDPDNQLRFNNTVTVTGRLIDTKSETDHGTEYDTEWETEKVEVDVPLVDPVDRHRWFL